MEWARILAYITGTVDQELLLRNEYLVAENRILKAQLQGRLPLSDAERARLEIGYRLGRKALEEVATAAIPDTIFVWYRRLVARKFNRSRGRRRAGRPPIDKKVEGLIVRMAKENRSWGYDWIVGALANLGYHVSDQTVGNVLRRHGMTTTWAEFIRVHLAVLAGTDFFTAEVLTLWGLVTYYVLPRRSRKRTHLRSLLRTHQVRRLKALVTARHFPAKPAALHHAAVLIPTSDRLRGRRAIMGPIGRRPRGVITTCPQRWNCGPRTDA